VFTLFINWLRLSTSIWGRALVGSIGGAFIALSYPAFNFWPGIFIGYFLILVSIRLLGFFKAFIVGTLAGFAFFGILLKWLTTYLGPIPWFAGSLISALIFGLAAAIAAVVWRYLATLNLRGAQPFVIALLSEQSSQPESMWLEYFRMAGCHGLVAD